MTVTVTTRASQSTPLSYDQMDGNFNKLADGVNASVQSSALLSNSVPYGASLVGYKGRSLYSRLSDIQSILDFPNIDNTNTIDSYSGITSALNLLPFGSVILFPQGQYKSSQTLIIPTGITIFAYGATINYTGSSVGVQTAASDGGSTGPYNQNQHIFGLKVNGVSAGTIGFNLISSIQSSFEDLSVSGTWSQAGFSFSSSFGNGYSNFSTAGASISGNAYQIVGVSFNANILSNMYTSNFSTNSFLVNCSISSGNVINMLTVQGGRYGLNVQNNGYGVLIINGLYSENTVTPIILGQINSSTGAVINAARAVEIRGISAFAPSNTNPNYSLAREVIRIEAAYGCLLSSIDYDPVGTTWTQSITFARAIKLIIENLRTSGNLGTEYTKMAMLNVPVSQQSSIQMNDCDSNAQGGFIIKSGPYGANQNHAFLEWTGTTWSATSIAWPIISY